MYAGAAFRPRRGARSQGQDGLEVVPNVPNGGHTVVDKQPQRGFVEVSVHVDEAGVDGLTRAVDHVPLIRHRRLVLAYRLDAPAVVDDDVGGRVVGGADVGGA